MVTRQEERFSTERMSYSADGTGWDGNCGHRRRSAPKAGRQSRQLRRLRARHFMIGIPAAAAFQSEPRLTPYHVEVLLDSSLQKTPKGNHYPDCLH